MNLDEFKKHVIAQREASKAEALSVLSATITKTNEKYSTVNLFTPTGKCYTKLFYRSGEVVVK